MIPYGKQSLDEEDIKEVIEVLRSDFLTTGPKIDEFEEKFANYVGSKYAVVVSSGTAALHLACLTAGLKKDDELITSPNTFVASSNCALYCGAKPVFVDVNDQGLINESEIETKINNRTKIIIPVHYSGLPCNMERIREIATKHNLVIIADASHALGARYKGSIIGDCKYSDMTIFSFHPVKHITTGEGGMITTNSKELYEKLRMLRTHGITKNLDKCKNEPDGLWYYEMQFLGFNYRITDLQCALGISQLDKIDYFIEERKKIAQRYDQSFKDMNIETIKGDSVYHLYIIKCKDAKERLELFNYLREKGILCQVHYIPVYWQPYYQKLGYKKGICPKAERFYERIISLPIYPRLTGEEQLRVIKEIGDFYVR